MPPAKREERFAGGSFFAPNKLARDDPSILWYGGGFLVI
jgi:hypothetical protein